MPETYKGHCVICEKMVVIENGEMKETSGGDPVYVGECGTCGQTVWVVFPGSGGDE